MFKGQERHKPASQSPVERQRAVTGRLLAASIGSAALIGSAMLALSIFIILRPMGFEDKFTVMTVFPLPFWLAIGGGLLLIVSIFSTVRVSFQIFGSDILQLEMTRRQLDAAPTIDPKNDGLPPWVGD